MTGIETAALIATVAGAAVSAIGQIQQGKAAKQAGEYNALTAERNALVARQQASAEATAQQREASQRLGAIRAAYGASGVTVEGSPLDVLSDSASLAELDRQTIEYKGSLRALGYEDTAALDRAQGKSAQRAGYMGAASSVLMGASDIAGKAPKKSAGSPLRAESMISEDFY
jgi:hypothetical protein